jgi:DNA-binding response OmpR family regulator
VRILLIDDDKDICQLTQKALTLHGYKVDAFCDPMAGIKHAQSNKPNLILMDIMLPGLSGPEIIKSLKESPQFKDIPVIFLTGLVTGDENSLEEGIMVGAQMYQTLGKPYEIEKLLAAVKKYAQ